MSDAREVCPGRGEQYRNGGVRRVIIGTKEVIINESHLEGREKAE